MFSEGLFPAIVKDNKDPLMSGRVQIYVDHLHKGITNTALDLPWAYPFGGTIGGSFASIQSCIPEKNSSVWVFFEKPKLFENPFYVSSVVFEASAELHNRYTTMIKVLTDTDSAYPDMKFTLLKNLLSWGMSSSYDTPEGYIYHPKGTTVKVDKDGNVKVDIIGTGKVQVETLTSDIEFKSTSGNIKAVTTSGDVEIESTSGKIKTKGTWEHEGDMAIKTGKLEVDLDITWLNSSTPTRGSTHTHESAIPGPPGKTIPGT
jgi:hypothetical protein